MTSAQSARDGGDRQIMADSPTTEPSWERRLTIAGTAIGIPASLAAILGVGLFQLLRPEPAPSPSGVELHETSPGSSGPRPLSESTILERSGPYLPQQSLEVERGSASKGHVVEVPDSVRLTPSHPQRIVALSLTLACRFDMLGDEPYGELTVAGGGITPHKALLHALQRTPLKVDVPSKGEILFTVSDIDYAERSVQIAISRAQSTDSPTDPPTPPKGSP